MMMRRVLQQAFDNGQEVILCTRYMGDCIQGRIQDMDEEHVSIFHACPNCGTLWVFPLADVVSVGLVINPPNEALLDPQEVMAEEPFPPSYGELPPQ